jgi:hypothetical protein
MDLNKLTDLHQFVGEWSQDLEQLRQNWLLSENSFLSFARDCGISVRGVITGEPGEFHEQGWLSIDGTDCEGGLRFHPFRMYPLHRILAEVRMARAHWGRTKAACAIA